MKQVSGYRKFFIAEMGLPTGDPATDTINWKDLGRAKGGNAPEITPNSTNDTFNRPMFASATAGWVLDLTDLSNYDAVKAFETAEKLVVIAGVKADGSYEYFKNIAVAARIVPTIGKDGFQYLRVYMFGTHLDITKILSTTYTE